MKYSSSVEDYVVILCFLECQVIVPLAFKKTCSVMDFSSSLFLYMALVKPLKVRYLNIVLYVIPYSYVPDRYRKIHFNTVVQYTVLYIWICSIWCKSIYHKCYIWLCHISSTILTFRSSGIRTGFALVSPYCSSIVSMLCFWDIFIFPGVWTISMLTIFVVSPIFKTFHFCCMFFFFFFFSFFPLSLLN